ncbi:MAG: NB-ARC domain-containing protein [Pseudomonadota bacterium]
MERGNPVDESNAELCAATLAEVTALGGWQTTPDALNDAFASDFNNAFAASLGAILKKDDDVFRIWLVLKQQATDETLQQVLTGLNDLSPHKKERDGVALALAENAEALKRMEDQLTELSGLAVRNLEETISVKITGEETNEDVKEVLSTVKEILRLLGLFLPQTPTAQAQTEPVPLAHPPIYNVTGTPNRLFTGRETMLTALDDNIRAGTKTAITAVQGMGGIGKTSLAREYVFEHGTAKRFAGVWWIPAETPASILTAYENLANTLKVPGLIADDVRQTAQNTIQWLARQPADHPYLIVLDNAPDDQAVKDYIPGGTTKVIITTRDQNFSTQIAEPLSLDLWDEDTTFAFLRERIGLKEDNNEETAAELRVLARELGGLPLAAEQAGAYLSQNRWITPGEYTVRLAENLNHAGTTPLDYNRTVYATFSLALDAILEQADGEAAQGLINLIAWLSPDGVPLALLQSASVPAEIFPQMLLSVLTDPQQTTDMLAVLQRYSLLTIRIDHQEPVLCAHRLIGAVARRRQLDAHAYIWRDAAIFLLSNCFPEDTLTNTTSWPKARRVVPHIRAISGFVATTAIFEDVDLAKIISSLSIAACQFMKTQGLFEESLYFSSYAKDMASVGFFSDLPLIAKFFGQHAAILEEFPERYDESEKFYAESLKIKEKYLENGHLEFGATFQNFAGLLCKQKKFAKAISFAEKSASIYEKCLGKKSIPYSSSIGTIGSIYSEFYVYSRNIEHLEKEFFWKRKELKLKRFLCGLRSFLTARAENNIGVALAHSGDNAAFAKHTQYAISIALSLDLRDHPYVKKVTKKLEDYFSFCGQPEKAQRLANGDYTDLIPIVEEIEEEHRQWVAQDPDNRKFGPPSPITGATE